MNDMNEHASENWDRFVLYPRIRRFALRSPTPGAKSNNSRPNVTSASSRNWTSNWTTSKPLSRRQELKIAKNMDEEQALMREFLDVRVKDNGWMGRRARIVTTW